MSLQSPTTLLTSIQSMRSKLRNDKQLLIDIRNDFSQIARPVRPPPQSPLPQIEEVQEPRREKSSDRAKERVLALKKEQQREVAKLKEQHEEQMKHLRSSLKAEMEAVRQEWKMKVEEQANYIEILEEQVNSQPSHRELPLQQQYEAVINNLLKDNTRLHESLKRAEQETLQLRSLLREKDSLKNRLRFAKNKRTDSQATCYESLPSQRHRNDENVDSSNLPWVDQEINDEEGGLRTIREFQHSVSELSHCR